MGGENLIRVGRGSGAKDDGWLKRGTPKGQRAVESRCQAGTGIWLGIFKLMPMTTGIGARKDARPATCTRWWDQPWEGGRSGSELAGVTVMKPANLGEGYHIAHPGRLNRTRIRAVVVQ